LPRDDSFPIDVKTLLLLHAPYIEKRVITFKDIEAARDRIAGAVYYSPCGPSIPLSEATGMEIFCKLDSATPSRNSRPTNKKEA